MVALTSKPIISLPTQDDLPCDDGVPMETQRHKFQMDLLLETIYPWLAQRQDGYASGNMFVYFSANQLRNEDFKRPDFFAVLNVPQTERKSWVVWEEGKAPDVVIELLSESIAETDKNEIKLIYQNRMRVPEYFWYDPFNPDDWAGFTLHNGVYQPLLPDAQNRYVSEQLGLALVRWYGSYRGVNTTWLRWETRSGELLPTQEELVQQVQAEAKQAQLRANQAEEKMRKLADRLKEMGIDPNII